MYFRDFDLSSYHNGPYDSDNWRVPLYTIGWLEKGYPFSQGAAPQGLVELLRQILANAQKAHSQVNFRGLHCCSFCYQKETATYGLPMSHVNLFIPGGNVVYIAPAGIIHYIEVHSYLPPQEFIAAIEKCPTYGSPEYFAALRAANQGEEIPLEPTEESNRKYREHLQAIIEARNKGLPMPKDQ